MPHWLPILSWISLAVAIACAAVIALDLLRFPQHMWIMNIVWPVTALYAGPLALWFYFTYGRLSSRQHMMRAKAQADGHDAKPGDRKPFPAVIALAATHCGAGCTLGDLVAEWAVVLIPALGAFAFRTKMFNAWIVDFAAAFALGIVFQYFTIVPMRKLPPLKGVWQAIKADTLSLTAWQIGMYGWMAVAVFLIFGHEIPKTSPVFWFMMQIAMLFGFATAFPVNWWLVRAGVKEKM
jgi:hypothetical protein